jgi:hypothetical protein
MYWPWFNEYVQHSVERQSPALMARMRQFKCGPDWDTIPGY